MYIESNKMWLIISLMVKEQYKFRKEQKEEYKKKKKKHKMTKPN